MLPASSNNTNSRQTAASRNATGGPIQNSGAMNLNKKRPAPPAHQEVRANACIKRPRHCRKSSDGPYAHDVHAVYFVIQHH
jgi:hypothetical protein